jgi:hypothetical protein
MSVKVSREILGLRENIVNRPYSLGYGKKINPHQVSPWLSLFSLRQLKKSGFRRLSYAHLTDFAGVLYLNHQQGLMSEPPERTFCRAECILA